MRIAVLVSLVVLLGGAGPHSRLPDHPDCGVYAFSATIMGGRRHGRLILAARVSSPEEALKIAHGAAQDMAGLIGLDVIEVHLGLPQDAPGLAVPGDAGGKAIARLRHVAAAPAGAAGAWEAELRPEPGPDGARGRRTERRVRALDGDRIAARIARDPLGPAERAGLCGIL